MKRTTGTFKQPMNVRININKLYDKIQETICDLVIDYLHTIADDIDDGNIDIEFDDTDINIYNIIYKGAYIYTHLDATLLDPPEDDMEHKPSRCDLTETDMQAYIQEHAPEWLKDFIQVANIDTDIDTEYVEELEYEPDWDTMPGGHDDY